MLKQTQSYRLLYAFFWDPSEFFWAETLCHEQRTLYEHRAAEAVIHEDSSGSRTDTETAFEQKEQSSLLKQACIVTALR